MLHNPVLRLENFFMLKSAEPEHEIFFANKYEIPTIVALAQCDLGLCSALYSVSRDFVSNKGPD